MISKRLIIFTVICVAAFFVVKVLRDRGSAATLPTQSKQESGIFLRVSTTQKTFNSPPSFEVEIEGSKFALNLDLGYEGEVSVLNSALQGLMDKNFKGLTTVRGLRGNSHQKKVFEIPKLNVGHLIFSSIVLEEETEQLQEEGIVRGSDSRFVIPYVLGKVGWKLFRNTVLLLDLGRNQIAIGDSVETFQQQGYSFESFTKAPLLLDRGFVEVEALTSRGPLRCFLDTGCTCNLVHTENIKGDPLAKMMIDRELAFDSPIFQICEKDFGRIIFHPFPIKFHIPVDVVLGMEFLSEHVILLDFKNREIFIAARDNRSP